jgi:GxxExxY protein
VCLLYELHRRGLKAENQILLPIQYGPVGVDAGYRVDVWVEDAIILELKTLEAVLPVHKAQLLSYLRLSDKRLGLLINFNVTLLKHGISRIVNEF